VRAKSRERPVESTKRSGCFPPSHGACSKVSAASWRRSALNLRAHLGPLRAEFIRALVEEPVESGPRGIVGVGRQDAFDGLETKVNFLAEAESESDARLVLADRRGAVLDAEPAQHGHDGRDERLADDQVRAAPVVKDGHLHAFLREETGQGRARRAAADDADGIDFIFHRWIFPLAVSGTLSTNRNSTGTLYRASAPRQ